MVIGEKFVVVFADQSGYAYAIDGRWGVTRVRKSSTPKHTSFTLDSAKNQLWRLETVSKNESIEDLRIFTNSQIGWQQSSEGKRWCTKAHEKADRKFLVAKISVELV